MTAIAQPATNVITAVKTAVFKLHNPSQRKKAMLNYVLLHNHLAYTKALKAVMPDIKQFVGEELQCRLADKDLPTRERKRREFLGALGGAAVGLPQLAHAQQAERVRRIVFGAVKIHNLHNHVQFRGSP